MAFLRNLLFVGVFIATIVILITTLGSEQSTDEAQLFLSKLKQTEAHPVILQFGDNTCHCQPRGGYMAYLKFQSGENDNLAFLFGKEFKIGEMTSRAVPTVEKVKGGHLAWEEPESTEVDVAISFDKAIYSPYFLPRDMAYGYDMKEEDLRKFFQDPSPDFWRDLSIRLRPTLDKGLVPPPAAPDPNRKPEFTSDYLQQLLSGEDVKYLRPADAGEVLEGNAKVPASRFEKSFPRLKGGILRLYIGRRGRFQRWAVKKGRFKDPVFELENGKELALVSPPAALVEKPGLETEQEEEQVTPQTKR